MDKEKLYVLRLFERHGWINVSTPVSKREADKLWNAATRNGTRNTKYKHGDYYKVFPADTHMLYTPEHFGE